MARESTITVEELDADPYPFYAYLRRERPVAYVPAVNMWMVTRAADVEYVTTHPELFTAAVSDSPIDVSFGGPTMLTMDGPGHLDLRKSLDAKYKPRVVASYIDDLVTPFAQAALEGLLTRTERKAELMYDYFEPISVLSLGAVLGLSHLSAETLQEWFHGLATGAINYERDPEKQRISDETAEKIDLELRPLMERLQREPDDSTIASMLTSGCPVGKSRSIDAVMPSLKVIITGGMQEPGHGAGSCMYGLLANPDQLAWVREDPRRWDDAVHEGLRWVAPIGTQVRQSVQEIELHGITIPAGSTVGALLSSACRDESVFANPDDFDVRRPRVPNAAFGYGSHFCAGHAFARGQEAIALRLLAEAIPDLRLDDNYEVEFRGWEFRAPAALHVRW